MHSTRRKLRAHRRWAAEGGSTVEHECHRTDERRHTAQIVKGALRRLALQQLEPTPEHFAKAYAQEAGMVQAAPPAPSSESCRAWAALERADREAA